MADHTAWCSVLDDTDDATAQLIISLQLLDIEEARNSEDGDSRMAREAYETELRECLAIRQADDDHVETMDHQAPIEQSVLFDCVACQNPFDVNHCHQVPCEHWYCDECLEDLFTKATTDESLYPPRCCQRHVPFEDISTYLPETVRQQFEAKREELDDRSRVYCREKSCDTGYIGHVHRDGDVATCPECHTTTCVHCNGMPHAGECEQDEATRQLKELAAQEGWQKCKACNRTVELGHGCNHITCICRAEFCYICGATWRTCECPQWQEERLLDRANAIVGREPQANNVAVRAARVAAEVQNLRERHECDHGNWQHIDGRHQCEECQVWLPRFIMRCRQCRLEACWRCIHNRL